MNLRTRIEIRRSSQMASVVVQKIITAQSSSSLAFQLFVRFRCSIIKESVFVRAVSALLISVELSFRAMKMILRTQLNQLSISKERVMKLYHA